MYKYFYIYINNASVHIYIDVMDFVFFAFVTNSPFEFSTITFSSASDVFELTSNVARST